MRRYGESMSMVAAECWAGMTVLPAIFEEKELEAARSGQEAFYQGNADLKPEFSWPEPRPVSGRSRKHPYASFFRSELAAIARSSVLAERIREVTGCEEVRFWHDQLLWEEPRERESEVVEYHWHTERSRWKTCGCALMVTAWIPLDEITKEMGPITMVPESHRHRWIDLPEGWKPSKEKCVSMVLRSGDVSLHCWHTIHGNPPNRASSVRRVMAVHFACGPIRYRRCGRFSHVNERVVREVQGMPDFTDERVCPLMKIL